MINTITQRVQLHNKYKYTIGLKSHNYCYGINKKNGLADDIGR